MNKKQKYQENLKIIEKYTKGQVIDVIGTKYKLSHFHQKGVDLYFVTEEGFVYPSKFVK